MKEFIQNFVRVFNKFFLKIKNRSCDVTKVLKKAIQISCPIQQNGIDCGLLAVVICLHIFEGTEIVPHIFTQHDITKLRSYLSLLAKDRNERYYGIWSILTTCHHHCHHHYPLKVHSQDLPYVVFCYLKQSN